MTAIAIRVRKLASEMALTHDDVGRLVHASPRAVSRWTAGETVPHKGTRKRLLDLGYVADQLSRVMQPQDANLWLFSRNPLLDGDTPAQRIETGDVDAVIALIEALADGVVV
jgi:hypothetical protein